MKMRLMVLWGMALAFMASPCFAETEIELAPHRAVYRLVLDKVRSGSNISNVEGTMLFDWADACDGWAIQQRMKLHFSHEQDEETNIDSAAVMWESKDGARYNFNIRRLIEGQEDENYKGRVETSDKKFVVSYTMPKDKILPELPEGTVFPASHTKLILQMAKAGENFFARRVFDGSDENGSADVSAFIGPVIEGAPDQKMSQEILSDPLLKSPARPVRLAFFAPDTETPDYEMDLILQENGIARSMRIDYGDFSVKGDLVSLETPVPSLCP